MSFYHYNRLVVAALAVVCVFVVVIGNRAGTPAFVQVIGILLALGAALIACGARKPKEERTPAHPVPDRGFPVGFGQAILERLPAPLLVIGRDARVVYANPAALALLPGARIGLHFSALIRAPAFIEAMEEVISEGRDVEFSFSQLRGQERHYVARASFLPAGTFGDPSGQDHVLVLIEDRTRDKAMLQSRSDFVANASHELRTPLASILGYIETLQGHAKDDPDARELFLGIMAQQAGRMQRLVDDLMSLNRIELNAHVPPDEHIDLYQVAAEAAAAMFPIASEHDVLLQIELDEKGPILGDRDQIAQVVVNLVDNAIKYGGKGKKVVVRAAEPSPRYPGHVGVSVIDQGPGIAREKIPRLTERFYRVSDAKSREVGGTGLGLAITKHILSRHNGALEIQSQQGEGSRFTLWIRRDSTGDQMGNHRKTD